eukprot:scaffold269_cov123-Isochrysis_galbana.AAC.11
MFPSVPTSVMDTSEPRESVCSLPVYKKSRTTVRIVVGAPRPCVLAGWLVARKTALPRTPATHNGHRGWVIHSSRLQLEKQPPRRLRNHTRSPH